MDISQKGNILYDLIRFNCLIDFYHLTGSTFTISETIKSLLLNALSTIPITSYNDKESAQTLYYINYIHKQSQSLLLSSSLSTIINFKLLFYIPLSSCTDISKYIAKYTQDKQSTQDTALSELTRLIIINQQLYDEMLSNIKSSSSTTTTTEYGVIYSPPDMNLLKDILTATLTEMITRQFYFISSKPPLIHNNVFTIQRYKDILIRINELIQLHSYDIAITALKMLHEVVEPEIEKIKIKEMLALTWFYQYVFYNKIEYSKDIDNLLRTAINGYKKLKEYYKQCETLLKLAIYYAYFDMKYKDAFNTVINNIYECLGVLTWDQQVKLLLHMGWLFKEMKMKRKYAVTLYMCVNVCVNNNNVEQCNLLPLVVKELITMMGVVQLNKVFRRVNSKERFDMLHGKVLLSSWKYNKVLLLLDNGNNSACEEEYTKKKFEKGMNVVIRQYIRDNNLNELLLQPKWCLIQQCIFTNILKYFSIKNDVYNYISYMMCYLQTLNTFLTVNEQQHIMNTFLNSNLLLHNNIYIYTPKLPIVYKLIPKTSNTLFDIYNNTTLTTTTQQLFLYNPWEQQNNINYYYTKCSLQYATVTLKNILHVPITLNRMYLLISLSDISKYKDTDVTSFIHVYPSTITIQPLTEVNVNLQFKLLNECEFNIDGIEYEMNSIKTTQYVDCNGNGLFYGNVNEYNNPLTLKKASSSSLRKKKTLLSLHNIKIYPEIPLINVNLVDNDEIMFNRNCIVLYEHQLCELVFDVTNIGRYNVDYIKASVYVYKREDYKVMIKESTICVDNICIKTNEHVNVKVSYLHKRSHLKIEIRFHYMSKEFKCINKKDNNVIINPFVQVVKDITTECVLTYDHFKCVPKLNCNNTYNELIKCDNKCINVNLIKEYIYCNESNILTFIITNISNSELTITISHKQQQQASVIINESLPIKTSKRFSIETTPSSLPNIILTWNGTYNGVIPLTDIIPTNIISPLTQTNPIHFAITATPSLNDYNIEYTLLTYSITNNTINTVIHSYTLLIYIYTTYNDNITVNDSLITNATIYYEGNLTYHSLTTFKPGDTLTKTIKLYKLNKLLLLTATNHNNNIRTTCMLYDNVNNILYLNPFDKCI